VEKSSIEYNPLTPATEKEGLNCAECWYFFKAAGDPGHQCRRHPPTGVMMVGPGGRPTPASFWPPVNGHQWCGEFLDKSVDETFKPQE
jgi:hypothetical protein